MYRRPKLIATTMSARDALTHGELDWFQRPSGQAHAVPGHRMWRRHGFGPGIGEWPSIGPASLMVIGSAPADRPTARLAHD